MKALVPTLVILFAATPAATPALAQMGEAPNGPPPAPVVQAPPPVQLPAIAPPTPMFASFALASGNFEIQAARLALSRSRNPEVRQFAERMISDHGKLNRDLERVMASDPAVLRPPPGAPPAVPPLSSPPPEQARLGQLQYAYGPEFDPLYVAIVISDHRDDALLFRAYARAGAAPSLRAYARRSLPVILAHLGHIERLQRAEAVALY